MHGRRSCRPAAVAERAPSARRGAVLLAVLLTFLTALSVVATAGAATPTVSHQTGASTPAVKTSGGPTATINEPGIAGTTSQTVTAQTSTAAAPTETETETATQTQTQTVTATATASSTTHTATTKASATTRTHPVHTKPKPAPPAVAGWLATTTAPRRAMVLEVPGQSPKTDGVTIAEDGRPVAGTTVTSMSQPGAGDLAVEFLIDQNTSMGTGGITTALGAARAFAGTRSPHTQLGLMSFAAQPSVQLTPTTNSQAISQSLQVTPPVASGADLSVATSSLVTQLAQTRALFRVAVVISDGVNLVPTAATAREAAANSHTEILTVGLSDAASTPASLAALKRQAPGLYVQTTPALLAATVVSVLASQLNDTAVAHWTSHLTGSSVAVKATVAGAQGAVQTSYQAPPAPQPTQSSTAHKQPTAGHHAHAGAAAPAGASALSPSPGFTTTTAATVAPAPAGGFWHSGASKLLTALLIALLVGAIVMLLLRPRATVGVRERVGRYIPQNDEEEGFEHVEAKRAGLSGMLAGGRFWPPFVEAVEISRNPKSPAYLMRRALIVSLPVGLVFAFVSHVPLLFIVPVLASPFAERWWVFRAATKQRDQFRDSLPSYMQDMASAIRVGRSFVGALAVVADSADEPTRSEFERAVTDESLGRPLDESLAAVGLRMQSMEMDQIALIAELNRRSGSNVAEALDRVADGARDRADLLREMKALTAQAKMSSSVLTGMPVVLLLGLSVIAPSYSHPLFHSKFGWVALAFAMILVISGWKVMKKISDVGA